MVLLLHQNKGNKILYDNKTGKYMRYRDDAKDTAVGGSALLVQPFMIYAIERVIDRFSLLSGAARISMGFLVFFVSMLCMAGVTHVFLYYWNTKITKRATEIPEPGKETRKRWTVDHPRRIRNSYKLKITLSAISSGVFIMFLWSGAALLMIFALCIEYISYFLWAISRPDLLRKWDQETQA